MHVCVCAGQGKDANNISLFNQNGDILFIFVLYLIFCSMQRVTNVVWWLHIQNFFLLSGGSVAPMQVHGWLAELGLIACWLVHPCADGRAGGCLLCSPCDGKCDGEHLHWCAFPRLPRISGTLRTRKGIATCGSALEWPHRGRGLSVSGLPCVAGLPQASACQAGQRYSKVLVMVGTKAFCPQVADFQMRAGSGLPLDLRQGEEAPGLKAWRWQTGSQLTG